MTGPVRACFRLVEPAETDSDQTWQVRLALQATDEPSLVVDAAQVWRARGQLPALARHLDSPQETLLAELGKARRVYPELDTALRTARPTVLPLDTTAAHSFLQAAAPALATAGFGVQLPGWWTKPSSRLGVRITASTPPQPGAVAGSAATRRRGDHRVPARPGHRWPAAHRRRAGRAGRPQVAAGPAAR